MNMPELNSTALSFLSFTKLDLDFCKEAFQGSIEDWDRYDVQPHVLYARFSGNQFESDSPVRTPVRPFAQAPYYEIECNATGGVLPEHHAMAVKGYAIQLITETSDADLRHFTDLTFCKLMVGNQHYSQSPASLLTSRDAVNKIAPANLVIDHRMVFDVEIHHHIRTYENGRDAFPCGFALIYGFLAKNVRPLQFSPDPDEPFGRAM